MCVRYSAADQRRPVGEVVDLSGLVQLLVSVCQCQLVAKTHFTLNRKKMKVDLQ